MGLESSGELGLVGVAYAIGDLRDIDLALAQQTSGLLHAEVAEELTRGDAGNILQSAM